MTAKTTPNGFIVYEQQSGRSVGSIFAVVGRKICTRLRVLIAGWSQVTMRDLAISPAPHLA
jgi:hypothetical protein